MARVIYNNRWISACESVSGLCRFVTNKWQDLRTSFIVKWPDSIAPSGGNLSIKFYS